MEKKAIICIICCVVFSFASRAQLAFEIDSITLHTLSNTERIEDTVHTLYSDIWWMGPVVEIYGRLINYSDEDLVLESIWEDKETGAIVTDVSVEFSILFEYKGEKYENTITPISPFINALPFPSKEGRHDDKQVSYHKLSAKKFVKYKLTSPFLYGLFGYKPPMGNRLNKKLETIALNVLPTLKVIINWEMCPEIEIETNGDPSKYRVVAIE